MAIAAATPADASAASWSITLSAVHARWTSDELAAAAFDQSWPGLEHYRTVRGRHGRSARRHRRQHLDRQWARAVEHVAAAAPFARRENPERGAATALAEQVAAAAASHPQFRGCEAALTRLAILTAVLEIMHTAGALAVDLDMRRWADMTASSRSAVHRHVHELLAAGWIVRTRRSRGTRSATYTVRVCMGGTQDFPPPASPNPFQNLRARLAHGHSDVWTHHSLGRSGALIHQLLSSTAFDSAATLAEASALPLALVEDALDALVRAGMVSRFGLTAHTGPRAYETATRHLGVPGVLEQRRLRHRRESLAWATWCTELENRRGRRRRPLQSLIGELHCTRSTHA